MLTAWFLVGCVSSDGGLQAALDDLVASDPGVPGAILVVSSPDLEFSGASGWFSFEDDARALRPDDLFRAASVTKTFVAAAVLKQADGGALSLDDALSDRLSEPSLAALRDGGYDPDAITVRMLLDHSAGMYDYTEAEAYYDAIAADPTHRWTRAEQLAVAMAEGEPLNEPGAEYHYGDTHYIIAGEVLERAAGTGLAEALRASLTLDAIGLTDTWLETLEDPPSADALERLSHPYIGDEDTRSWDPSWDLFGGGGLVASAEDLVRFLDALMAGEILGDAALEELLTVSSAGVGAFSGIDGGMGINRFELDDGTACWACYGFFGTEVVACPDLELVWAGTVNQSEARDGDALTNAVLDEAL